MQHVTLVHREIEAVGIEGVREREALHVRPRGRRRQIHAIAADAASSLVLALAVSAAAQERTVAQMAFAGGRVTLEATDTMAAGLLAQCARTGQAEITGARDVTVEGEGLSRDRERPLCQPRDSPNVW